MYHTKENFANVIVGRGIHHCRKDAHSAPVIMGRFNVNGMVSTTPWLTKGGGFYLGRLLLAQPIIRSWHRQNEPVISNSCGRSLQVGNPHFASTFVSDSIVSRTFRKRVCLVKGLASIGISERGDPEGVNPV